MIVEKNCRKTNLNRFSAGAYLSPRYSFVGPSARVRTIKFLTGILSEINKPVIGRYSSTHNEYGVVGTISLKAEVNISSMREQEGIQYN
jgi:hypothetical protein